MRPHPADHASLGCLASVMSPGCLCHPLPVDLLVVLIRSDPNGSLWHPSIRLSMIFLSTASYLPVLVRQTNTSFISSSIYKLSSVQFSHSVVSDSLWPHESQHARLPCPSPIPRVYSNSCPLSQWCHPDISSSVVPFSSCPQSLPASGSFPMSQLCVRWPKYWSFSFSISLSNEHPGLISFKMDWLDLLAIQGTLKSLFQHHSSKA